MTGFVPTRRDVLAALSAMTVAATVPSNAVAGDVESRIVVGEWIHRHGLLSDDGRRFVPEDRRDIAAAVRDDFSAGRILSVAGWQLSNTEALLCLSAYHTRVGRT